MTGTNASARRAAAVLLLQLAAPAHAGLCGDASGDGFFGASDALATLRYAVTSSYDRRGDVSPLVTIDGKPVAGDSKLTAGDALAVLRAVVETRVPLCKGADEARVAVTTAPFNLSSAGGFAMVDIATRQFEFRAGAITGDAVVRTQSGRPIVVNRHEFNSLQILDVEDEDLPNIKDCSVADNLNSNPQDVVLLSPNKGYVTAYAGGNLLVIDPQVLLDPEEDPACSTLVEDRIDLSGFDDDGVPEMDQMVLVGDDLFVALQLLDTDFKPEGLCANPASCAYEDCDCDSDLHCPGNTCVKGNGVLAVIDTNTDTVKGSMPLSFANPFAATKGLVYDEFQKRIFVGGPGTTGDVLDDGAIEAIDPVAMTSTGVLLTGADLHANIYDFVIVGRHRAFAVIADQVSNSVVDIDLSTRSVRKVLLDSIALITDIEMTEAGELWVAYRGEDGTDPSGLRIFGVLTGTELTAKPISLGQAPFTLAFLD